ncbi:MAG: hypothetical protein DRJ42_14905 [Deltaproteobacteria bacterium]|nr:MAG: hypothetical protein DRJ42_14905 [Deltaproteobacteria bacterium]
MPRFTLLSVFSLGLIALLASAGCGNSRRGGGSRSRGADSGAPTPIDGADTSVTDPDAGATGDAGEDAAPPRTCTSDFTDCDGSCVDIYTDIDHCGACGNFCEGDEYCEGGTCIDPGPGCASPRTTCGDSCVDTRSDLGHCGGCYNSCDGGEACRSGSCVSTCTPSCGGAECGDDGCGGSCGGCGSGETCTPSRYCEAVPTTGVGESCATAMPITSSASFIFAGHAADHTPFSCGTSTVRPDVVYVYTAPRGGDVTVTADSVGGEDTMLAVYDASSCGSADELVCSDDASGTVGGVGSSVTFFAASGQRYYLVVAPYEEPSAPAETITLTVSSPAAP